MGLSLIRKVMAVTRRTIRLKLFGNNIPVSVNLRHKWFHSRAKQAWTGTQAPSNLANILKWKTALRQDGYVQLEPGINYQLLDTIQNRVNLAFSTPEFCTSLTEGAVRLRNSIEIIPEISQFITKDIVNVIESYYGSFFKIYWAHIYRTLPTDKDPDTSFLWHVDNCPSQVVKLMVYLTDTRENTGSFRLKPRPLSKQMLDQGFWDRSRNDRFTHILNDTSTTKVFEGPKGTSILFLNWGCVHRAKHPEVLHRDAAVFFLVPSLAPWDQHLRENMEKLSLREDVCLNPALV